MRLDILATNKLATSRERVKKLIKAGFIYVDGTVQISPKFEVEENAVITCFGELTPQNVPIKPNNEIELDIIFEDEHLLVINKQKGLMVHEGTSENYKTIVNALLAKFGDDFQKVGSPFRPGIIHRLDKDTTGLMIIAKTQDSYHELSQMIHGREVTRKYLAVCFGKPRLLAGKIATNMGIDPEDRTKRKVLQVGGKHAITYYKVLEAQDNFSLIECVLDTGRTHQIRVHLSYIGHPIIGDEVYTKRRIEGFSSQVLHAYSIEFIHPITQEQLKFQCLEPFLSTIANFGFSYKF